MSDPTDDLVSDETRASETMDAQAEHDAEAHPTPEEEQAAERAAAEAPDVSEPYQDMTEKGANVEGEGHIA